MNIYFKVSEGDRSQLLQSFIFGDGYYNPFENAYEWCYVEPEFIHRLANAYNKYYVGGPHFTQQQVAKIKHEYFVMAQFWKNIQAKYGLWHIGDVRDDSHRMDCGCIIHSAFHTEREIKNCEVVN